jgi:hypothetical protein
MNDVQRETPDDEDDGPAPRRARGEDEHTVGLRARHMVGSDRHAERTRATDPLRHKDVILMRDASATTGRPQRKVYGYVQRSLIGDRTVSIDAGALE